MMQCVVILEEYNVLLNDFLLIMLCLGGRVFFLNSVYREIGFPVFFNKRYFFRI